VTYCLLFCDAWCIPQESNDRSLLKNLGSWLGLLTFARNKPVLIRELDIKQVCMRVCVCVGGGGCVRLAAPWVVWLHRCLALCGRLCCSSIQAVTVSPAYPGGRVLNQRTPTQPCLLAVMLTYPRCPPTRLYRSSWTPTSVAAWWRCCPLWAS
jgi:hypothetical protein